jgi:hypothetical protein
MRLSTAIRLGSLLHPQCYRAICIENGGHVLATCAMGAAYEAGFGADVAVLCIRTRCPVCDDERSLQGVIVHLNDFHQWSRVRIADWVATVEPHDEQDQEDARMDRPGVVSAPR